MIKFFLSFCFILLIGNSIGQMANLKFSPINAVSFNQSVEVWNVDNLGNIYAIQGNSLEKLDSIGRKMYTQSIKSIGKISAIEPINAMKTLLFSEEQQLVCFVDNTLSLNGDCKNLDDFQIQNAKMVAISTRSNLLWIYDEFRSTIILLDIVNNKVVQRVENLKGIIGTDAELVQMIEKDNYLYITTVDGKVYEFDQMLSETGNQYNDFQKVWSREKKITVELKGQEIILNDWLNDKNQRILSPENSILEFKILSDNFYFLLDKKISRYSLK